MAQLGRFSTLFEILFIILTICIFIMIIFAGLYYSFGFVKNSISGKAVSETSNVGTFGWFLITIVSGILVGLGVWILLKEDIIEIEFIHKENLK